MGPRDPSVGSTHCSPPISAGNSLSALLDGKARLTFLRRAEDYTLTMPYAHCKGESPSGPHPEGRAGCLLREGVGALSLVLGSWKASSFILALQ